MFVSKEGSTRVKIKTEMKANTLISKEGGKQIKIKAEIKAMYLLVKKLVHELRYRLG